MVEAGLDHDRLRDALDAQRLRSLEAIGLSARAVGIAERPLPGAGTPRWGASAERTIQRSMEIVKARGDRRILPTHLLLGALDAREGTVPRALEAAKDRIAQASE